MTRFARAKGSKASNERAPEDSTPWEVMKEQLLQAKKESEESKKREEAEKQRIENYENFLKEHKVQKRKATWCDFPDSENSKLKDPHAEPAKKKNKKNKQKPDNNSNTGAEQTTEPSIQANNKKLTKNKKKSNEQNLSEFSQIKPGNEDNQNASKKKKKNKKKKQNQQFEDVSQQEAIPEENNAIFNGNESKYTSQSNVKNQQRKPKKEKKLIDGQPARRKPINDHSFQLIINSKEIELVRFDGFPIMKKDADRLGELKKNMITKGIPKSEVQRTLKLERRRAEKALARLKKEVCYNCRKGGHNLSDCPDLKSRIPGAGAADGVCFKCGSTEHRQFECKVQKDKEFRFATCFICKEPGHIARQCPDNPKGLYPNGGNCKLCGDVTHLRKDCPTVMDKKEETSIKLHTLGSAEDIEGVETNNKTTLSQESTKKPKKIKF